MISEARMIIHPIKPVYNEESKILILGSFPSVKSREEGFFYGHPKNRFWRVMAAVCCCDVPICVDDKKNMLLSHYFALWDVVGSCDIQGSADSSIKNAVPNDIGAVVRASKIDRIFVNGKKAESLYIKFIEKSTGIKAVCLPSTSPANAAWSEERLVQIWKDKLTGRQ